MGNITSTVVYKGGLRTECTHLQSNTQILTDAPTDNEGKGEAFSPTDLVPTALASCIITIMGIIANRLQINIEGTYAEVQKVMSTTPPRKIAAIHITLNIHSPQPLTDKEKIMLENCVKTCPVALSLHPDIEKNTRVLYTII